VADKGDFGEVKRFEVWTLWKRSQRTAKNNS